MKEKTLSELVYERYSLYYRCVNKMYHKENREITDSNELSRNLKIDSSLIRRDLSLIGKMGKRGMGYSLLSLKSGIEEILGKDKTWNLVIVGLGNLGNAILRYLAHSSSNYNIIKVYEKDPRKINTKVEGHVINDMEHFDTGIRYDIGIIAVPSTEAQGVANILVNHGIKAILNFAPVKLKLPESIFYREVDIFKELDILSGMLTFEMNNH